MNKEEKQLTDLLIYINRPCLPDTAYDTKRIWIYAVATAAKIDGSKSYVVLQSIDGEQYKIKKDFGSDSAVKQISDIRPYVFLLDSYIPDFNSIDDIAKFLAKKDWNESGMSDDYATFMDKHMKKYKETDKAVLKSTILKLSIREQITRMNEKSDYYDKIYMKEQMNHDMSFDENDEEKKKIEEKQEKLKQYQKTQKKKNEKSGDIAEESGKQN